MSPVCCDLFGHGWAGNTDSYGMAKLLFVVLTSVSVMTRYFCVGNVCVFLSLMLLFSYGLLSPPKINPQLIDMHVKEFSTHSNSLIGW